MKKCLRSILDSDLKLFGVFFLYPAAAALFVGGKSRSLEEGWGMAAELIDSGRALKKLNDLRHAD